MARSEETDLNLSAVVDLEIKAFSNATFTRIETCLYNGMVDMSKGKPVVTQRPAIDLAEEASTARGRAIYFWDSNSTLYFLNDDTIYKGTYAGDIATTITAGTTKCKFLQLGSRLILVDSDDDAAYTITTGDVVAQIAGSIPATLVPGGVILNGYFFVMDDDGTIWNSDLDAPQTFSAGNFVNAEREEDGGVYLGKHHDHIVAFGERTIEFFYDNANPTNSPLNRREDIAHNIGCADGYSVWEDGDLTVFVGTDLAGGLSVYALENFTLKKISNNSIDTFLSQTITRDSFSTIGSGVSAYGHKFYTLTLHLTPSDISTNITLVYDFNSGLWHEWYTSIGSVINFPVMDITIRAGQTVRFPEGIMTNGDLFLINNDYVPQDTIAASIYVVTDYVVADYIIDTDESGETFTMKIRFGQFDGNTNKNKFMYNLRPRMSETSASQTMTVTWADNNEDNFITAGTFDTLYQYNNIRRCGRFNRRNIELQYSGTEQLWIESLEADIQVGTL